MGLDMTITKLINTHVNEKGHNVNEYEEIGYLRNSWEFLEILNNSCEYAFNGGTNVEFTGEQIYTCLEEIDNETEYNYVKEVLKKAEIENTGDEFYTISAWW